MMSSRLIIFILGFICYAEVAKSQKMCDEFYNYINDGGERRALIKIASDLTGKHLLRIKLSIASSVIVSVSN